MPREFFGNLLPRRRFLGSIAAAACAFGLSPVKLRALSTERPRITVLLIAEQFRSDYLTRNMHNFGALGFRRLLREASFFPDCRQLSTTFTSTALATLATGTYPDIHGIVANRWLETVTHKMVVADSQMLAAPTVFEQEIDPRNRFFALAINESKASFLKPTGPATVLFRRQDLSVTGTHKEPAWLPEFNRAHAIDGFRNLPWFAHVSPRPLVPLRVLHFDSAHPDNFVNLVAGSPFALASEMSLLREVILRENLGQTGYDTVACVLNSLGRLGIEAGGVSPLIDDEVLALDAEIATLFEILDARGLPCQFIFTAAHGVPNEPQQTARISGQDVVDTVEQALSRRFGSGKPAARFVLLYLYPFLYLRQERFSPTELPIARELAGRALMDAGQAATFYTADGTCPHAGDWQTRLRNSFQRRRSGDLLVIYPPGYTEYIGENRGVSYGSPFAYDAQVPLFLWGPQYAAKRFDHMIEMTDIAPTLAMVAGTTLPAMSTGRVLSEAFLQ